MIFKKYEGNKPRAEDANVRLVVQNLNVSVNKKPILSEVTLTANPCQITCIIGPSGSGKSTLLYALAGLLSEQFNIGSGSIFIENDSHHHSLLAACDQIKIGFVFQHPNPFPLSIIDNILFPLKEHGVKKRAVAFAIAQRVLTEVALWEEVSTRLNDSALTLSGGQQQRLCIARALALEPNVLLLDEPCSALDPMATNAIEELLVQLKQKYTIIMVTHNIAQASRLAERVVLLWPFEQGAKVVESGLSHQVLKQPRSAKTKLFLQLETIDSVTLAS